MGVSSLFLRDLDNAQAPCDGVRDAYMEVGLRTLHWQPHHPAQRRNKLLPTLCDAQ